MERHFHPKFSAKIPNLEFQGRIIKGVILMNVMYVSGLVLSLLVAGATATDATSTSNNRIFTANTTSANEGKKVSGSSNYGAIKQAIGREMRKHLEIVPIDSYVVDKVFSAKFYRTHVEWQGAWVDRLYAWKYNRPSHLNFDGTHLDGPSIARALDANFRIKDIEDVKLLRAALAEILRWRELDSNVPEIGRVNNYWVLISGTIFDDLSGYFIRLNDKGKPTGFRYELKIPRDKVR